MGLDLLLRRGLSDTILYSSIDFCFSKGKDVFINELSLWEAEILNYVRVKFCW